MKKNDLWEIVALPYLYFALGFVLLFVGLNTYFNGYHGVDLIFNRCLISLVTNNTEIMKASEILNIKDGKIGGNVITGYILF